MPPGDRNHTLHLMEIDVLIKGTREKKGGVSKLSKKNVKLLHQILAHFCFVSLLLFFWFSIVMTSDSSTFGQVLRKYQMSSGNMWSTEQGKRCANYALVFLRLRIYNLPLFFLQVFSLLIVAIGVYAKVQKATGTPTTHFLHTIYHYVR